MEKFEICVFLRYSKKLGFSQTATVKKIFEVKGGNVVLERTTRNWFKRFNVNNTDP